MIKTQFCSQDTSWWSCPNVFIGLRIMLNCPETVASAERSFSKMQLNRTFTRSDMTDSKLSSLQMLSIEASCMCSLDLDDVIKAFACQKTRSKPFWYYYNVTLFMIFSWLLLCNFSCVLLCQYTLISFVLLYDHGPPVE